MSICTDVTNNRKQNVFTKLVSGLTRTRDTFIANIANIFTNHQELDSQVNELATKLLTADVGITVTQQLCKQLQAEFKHKDSLNGQLVCQALQQYLMQILVPCEYPLVIPDTARPFMMLVVGVNGVGKTTTIAKVAHRLQAANYRVMLAAGDTFRAAAIDQLQVWGKRLNVPVIAQQPGADSAAVLYDAYQAACARGIDVLIADTAGRLHTQVNFMEELKKIKRVLQKTNFHVPHEILLVLDATTGQNSINQVKQFAASLGITGLCITKLDGTAKGGSVFAIAQETKLPLRFVGVGEGIDDLQPFVAKDFIDALFKVKI